MIKAETALKNSKEYWSRTRAEKVVDYIAAISSKIEEYSKNGTNRVVFNISEHTTFENFKDYFNLLKNHPYERWAFCAMVKTELGLNGYKVWYIDQVLGAEYYPRREFVGLLVSWDGDKRFPKIGYKKSSKIFDY